MKTAIAAAMMGVGIFLAGLSVHRGVSTGRAIAAGVLGALGGLWLPGVIADPHKYWMLGLIAFVFIGFALRVGVVRRGPA